MNLTEEYLKSLKAKTLKRLYIGLIQGAWHLQKKGLTLNETVMSKQVELVSAVARELLRRGFVA